jgi:hypothetical protein
MLITCTAIGWCDKAAAVSSSFVGGHRKISFRAMAKDKDRAVTGQTHTLYKHVYEAKTPEVVVPSGIGEPATGDVVRKARSGVDSQAELNQNASLVEVKKMVVSNMGGHKKLTPRFWFPKKRL